MKKNLLSILLVAVGLSVFSQPATRILNMRPAYPLAIGESTVDSLVYAHNGLILQDIVQDSLPIYEIGHIFTQTVRYTEEGHGFYIKADSLHSNQVTYSYQTDTLPRGPIEFNSTTGRFIFYPLSSDYQSFVVRFSAASPTDTVWEDVEFDLMAQVVPEQYAFQSQGVMPDGEDYTLIASTDTTMFFNNENRTVYRYSISGKDIVFDENVQNKVSGLSGREDLFELNLFAERLIIRSALNFPQTNVTIYAKEIYFEDGNNETASINVSPTSIATRTNGQGLDGANAGNISLFVKKFHGNYSKRFILNGAKGQSTNRSDTTGHNNNNGTPGNGGNGGTVISNIDIQDYCDFSRGSGGLKFNVIADGPAEAGTIIEAGSMGQPGHFELQNNPFAFLHPYYITAVMRYANDAYVNNYMDHVFQLCKEYREEIEAYKNSLMWDSCGVKESTELQDAQMEMEQILFNIEQGLDYFGNSVGWVPLLSFEVMVSNFNAEMERAIPTLYMTYWLSKVDQTLQNMVIYNQAMANQTEQDIQAEQNNINSWLAQIPGLQNEFQIVVEKIDSLTYRQNILAERLMSKARHNVKKRHRISKAIGICKTLINCIPVYGQAISTAVNVASNIAYVINETGIDDYGFASGFNPNINYTSMVNQLNTVLGSWEWDSVGTNANYFKIKYDSLKLATAPLVSNIQNLQRELSKGSTPANEVEQEFAKLKASSAEWQSLEKDLILNNSIKTTLYTNITNLVVDIRNSTSKISNDVVALDAFRHDAFTGNSKRDLNAMQYLKKMEERTKNRLLIYHYYLRKAYEYRLLKPYVGEFNLVSLFERYEQLGEAVDSIVNEDAYLSLESVFRDVVSEMAEEIIYEYSTNMPEQTALITIVIPREQLDILNTDKSLSLNFYEMGLFAPDEDNLRIVNLGIQHIETHVAGNVGISGYMDLNMTHQGISRFRKNGQIYWFDHISRTTTNPHTWGIRYDANTNITTNIQPSFASSSLLYSILQSNADTMMLFSRPSVWGDINVTKKVQTFSGADIVIDSLVLRLQYDFTHRPEGIRNIDITTNEGLLPHIACSEVDRNGRSNGNGNLNRSYNFSNQSVTFSAIEQYGTWHFVNWTDRAGNIVSGTMDLTVNRSTDQFYRANYERRVPILSVPDTIFVNSTGGVYSVPVANVGSGDIEMDWYVSDSLSTWVHLNGLVEGVDDGNFSFLYEENETGTSRLDSLEIFAPETDIMSKMIYIVQTAFPGCNLSAFITPASVTICQGETATVTASGQSSLGNQFSYSWDTGETTPTINVFGGGERVVTVSDSNGCSTTASVNVTVNPLPTVAISGNTTLCTGESSLLTASGGSSYVWNTGATSPSITVSNGGTYSVTASNTYGCSSSASVQVISLENVSISGNLNLCQGQSTTLYANGTGNYLWSTGATSSSINVTQAGLYTVTVSTGNCSSSASATVSVATNPVPTISGNTTFCQGETSLLSANGGVSYVWSNGSTNNSVGISQSGTYSVTATSMEGCSGNTSVFVTVNPLPNVSISGNTTVCAGSSTTLTASGANTYIWSTGDNTASVNINVFGVYTVTGTSSEGCSNTATVTVLVSQLPQITITGETDICAGESTTLTANGGETYLWNDGTTDNTLTVSTAGTYQVIGYNAAGCNAMASATVNVWQPATSEFSIETSEACYTWNAQTYCTSGNYTQTLQTVHGCDSVVTLHLTITVGIDDHHLAASMTLYPNPTTGMVNVECTMNNKQEGMVEFQLFDAFGRLLRTTDGIGANDYSPLRTNGHGSSVQTQIDLSHYASGTYFVKAVADGKVMAVRKVVKN